MIRYVILVCVSGMILSGCASIEDYHYCYVNHRRAANAWKVTCSTSDRRLLSSDYEHGWKHGYFDVSTGGCGEPPVIPPNKYWSPRYQNEAGQAAIEDWYAGFQDGATAAESDGSGAFHYIPTGPTVPTEHFGVMPHHRHEASVDLLGEQPAIVAESAHFLPSFEPVPSWPPLPEIQTEKHEVSPESSLQKVSPSSTAAEGITVPPVITDD